ncbi:MAG TPA: amidohydrolase [Kofleriaceae bacterium]|nr:amidohydrolase [Kofleriaceae bacterium]
MLLHGDVFTPTGHKSAVAVRGGDIVAYDDAEKWIGGKTRVLDLAGKSVIVGLTDAHCHLYGLGVDMENVSVRALGSEAEVVKVISDAAKTRPASEWLIGRGWDQNRWAGQQFPTKATLDAAVSDRPVLLRRIDGHAIWVNSRALAEAAITKATKDPAGGKIVRDANGEPTGVLIDNATDLVDAKVPAATADVRERRILAAAKVATELGFTAVHEMGIEDATADVYRKLAAANQLPLRVYAYLAGDAAHADELRKRPPAPATGRFVMRGVKYFVDGALGSRGARLYEEYDDDKANLGLWVTEPKQLAAAVDASVAGGWQTAIHAIGDAGIGAVLDAYLAAQAKHPGDHRLRVEHTQVIAMKDVPRMVQAHAVASMQPTHATSDMPWAEARVGKQRIKGAYAWRTMLNEKIPLAFGSDFPVEEVNPLLGLDSAVNRGNWYPEQKLTLDEAVAAFTTGAAYAVHEEAQAGRRADLTVFDAKLTPTDLPKRNVLMTMVGGEIVFERQGALAEATGR